MELVQELVAKQTMEECKFCTERNSRLKNYEDEIEKEKISQCQMALEREKIANGMQCTKLDEVSLKKMQLMQMQEKRLIEEERESVERMWHELLLNTVRMKEQYERHEANRLQKEMVERRLFYDEQIASAKKKKWEDMNQAKEIENRRLGRTKKKMEKDYFEEIKRKKDQQHINKNNYLEGHENKLMRLRNSKKQERELDLETIRTANEELRKEKQQMKNKMQALRVEERVFVDNSRREKEMADKLEQETDQTIIEWERQKQKDTEEKLKREEINKLENKMIAAQEYKSYIEKRRCEMERDKQERAARMESVKKTAFAELRRNLDSANEEMRRQIRYRNNLTSQIKQNEKVLEAELNSIENKQQPFTKKPIMFKDAMADKVHKSRASTNPVHPFRRVLQTQSTVIDSKLTLPSIHNIKLCNP